MFITCTHGLLLSFLLVLLLSFQRLETVSANVTCWYGVQPTARVISGRVILNLRQEEVLHIHCEANAALYSDLTVTSRPEVHCRHRANTWLCPANQNMHITITGFRRPHFNDENLAELIVRVHNLTRYLEEVNATPTPHTPTLDYTTDPSESSGNADVGKNQQNSPPSELTTTTENEVATTIAREHMYPLYVVLCALFIPLVLVAGLVVFLLVVVKCRRTDKEKKDTERGQVDEFKDGSHQPSASSEVQETSTIGDTSSDNLT